MDMDNCRGRTKRCKSKKIIVVRKILAQLQTLLHIVEKKSTKFDENRKTLEVIQRSLEEIKECLNQQEIKLTSSMELIWEGIEETAICLKSLEEVSEFDKENSDDVYVPSYSRLDRVVREHHNRKSHKWKKLRMKLERLEREKEEENIPYRPGRQWEVIQFNFDSDEDCRLSNDPFASIPEKRLRLRRSTLDSTGSRRELIEGKEPSEDDENFAKYLENEAQQMHKPKHLKILLKSSSLKTLQQQGKIPPPNPIQEPVVLTPSQSLPPPPPVLQELSLNTEIDESPRVIEVPTTQIVVREPMEVVQANNIPNIEMYAGAVADTFEEMGLVASLLGGINLWGMSNPTPIQKKGIPASLVGHDLIVHAPEGQGKTSLAAISVLNRIQAAVHKPQALFLLPHPEAAELTMQAMGDWGTFQDFSSVCCKNPNGLETCHIFLGTPSSVYSLISSRKLCTDYIKTLVIDGAETARAENKNLIVKVLYNLGGATQVIILSRDLTQEISHLAQKLRSPKYISNTSISSTNTCSTVQVFDGESRAGGDPCLTINNNLNNNNVNHPLEIENSMPLPPSIDFENMNQFYVIVGTDELKISVLAALADTMEQEQAIIFCNTPQKADWLARKIRENEKALEVCSVHGGRQNREHLMNLFQAGVSRVLITTDFITRANFKVKPVPLVLNYEFPDVPENYTRRLIVAGRTRKDMSGGCADNPVLVFSFCNPENLPVLEHLAKQHDFTITPMSSQTSQ